MNIEKLNRGNDLEFPHSIKAVVFDLDGTLMNTVDDIASIMNGVLENHEYEKIDNGKYKYFLGNGASALLGSVKEERRISEKDFSSIKKEFMEQYGKSEIGKEAIYPGIMELLAALETLGIDSFVYTNKPHSIAESLMERVFPDIFSKVIGQEDSRPRKPHPVGLEMIQEEFSLEKGEILYLGDTNTDMETGKNFGCFTIGVEWGFRKKEELIEYGADVTIENPMDLIEKIIRR